jgi:hypothetical protein
MRRSLPQKVKRSARKRTGGTNAFSLCRAIEPRMGPADLDRSRHWTQHCAMPAPYFFGDCKDHSNFGWIDMTVLKISGLAPFIDGS